ARRGAPALRARAHGWRAACLGARTAKGGLQIMRRLTALLLVGIGIGVAGASCARPEAAHPESARAAGRTDAASGGDEANASARPPGAPGAGGRRDAPPETGQTGKTSY